jgi:hypothetical protein
VLVDGGDDETLKNLANLKGLRTIPPGFSRGLRLPGEDFEDEALAELDELPESVARRDDEIVWPYFTRVSMSTCLIRP